MQQSNFSYTIYSKIVYLREAEPRPWTRKIEYFFSVIEHGNLSSAAQSLRVSQPTLSRQIQSIEHQFQTPLFVRGGRGMMPTEAGKQLHEGLQRIERQLRALKTDVAAVSLEPSGEVAFGIPPSPRGLIAVPLVKGFNAAYPRIAVRIIEETSAQLRDLVANGLIDVAVTNTYEPALGVTAQQLGRERMLLVGPVSAKLSMRRETPINVLAELPLILTTRPNSLRLTIETGLGVHGLQPNVRFEANTLPLMTDLVTADLGYTVLPACGARQLLAQRKITASPIAGLFITWLVARPKAVRSAWRPNAFTICCANTATSKFAPASGNRRSDRMVDVPPQLLYAGAFQSSVAMRSWDSKLTKTAPTRASRDAKLRCLHTNPAVCCQRHEVSEAGFRRDSPGQRVFEWRLCAKSGRPCLIQAGYSPGKNSTSLNQRCRPSKGPRQFDGCFNLEDTDKTESCTILVIDAMNCYWALIHRPICGQCSLKVPTL